MEEEMEGGREIQTQIIITTCKLQDWIPLDDHQESGVAGSENGIGERKGNSSHLPATFKTPKEKPAEK